jgi:hypothetical protein
MSLDLRKDHPELYDPPEDPVLVEVPRMKFLMVAGSGAPDSDEYRHAIEAIYPLAFRLKFCLRDKDMDFEVMPLETLWTTEDQDAYWSMDMSKWKWTAMMRIPEAVCDDCYQECWALAAERSDSPSFGAIHMEDFEEGLAAQMLHVGPWSEERASVEKLHAFIAEQGKTPKGPHHEIYLSDPKRTKPQRLRTLIRQPVA